MSESLKPLLKVRDLKVHYPVRNGFLELGEKKTLKAVDGVSFDIFEGEILGLVGESGCGKSSLGRAVIRLIEPTSGEIVLDGTDFRKLKGSELRKFRPKIQMVFQDPYASLDPRMSVFDIVAEPLRVHKRARGEELNKQVREILAIVGLTQASLHKYPHEFSGGQRQRIAIARALILRPKIIVADEPVSSLDVSVQAQILNLLKDIQKEFKLSMLFISHNLSVVKYICDRIAVMYLGKMVETASCKRLFEAPLHPYTKALISAVPVPDPDIERKRQRIQIVGEIPSPINPPTGCAFHTRCPIAKAHCATTRPELEAKDGDSHFVSCLEIKH